MRVDEYNSFETLLPRYSKALVRLDELDIRLSEACRLRTYERRIRQLLLDPRPAVEAKLVYAATYDLREVDEIIEIVSHLPAKPDVATLQLLEKLAGGHENPSDEIDAPAREAQYELYLGTVLRRGQFSVRHGHPDLIATWHKQDFYIEAKRPSSLKRLDDRLRSAVHQVRKLSRPGIIALCTDQLVYPSNRLLTVPNFNSLAPATVLLCKKLLAEQSRTFANRLANENVAALLLTLRIPCRLESTGHSSLGTYLDLIILKEGIEAQFARRISRQYLEAQ